MKNEGFSLLRAYLDAPNELMRDVDGDVNSIVAILDALEQIHTLFLRMLIDLQGPETFLFSDAEYACDDDIF